jgi:type IV secretion system protein VirB8
MKLGVALPRLRGGNVSAAEPAQRPALRTDTGQGYRVAWWMAWIFAVYSIVSTLANVSLGMIVLKLWSVHEVVPMILTVSPRADQVVRVEPYSVRTKGFGLFVEAMLKGYVEKRETIDLHTEVPRWQEVAWMSGDEVFNAFRRLMEKGNKDSPFERYKREGVTRAVHVSVASEVSTNVYRVEWESTDSHLTEPRGRGRWVSTITVAFQEKAVKIDDRYMNPIGLQVVGYSVDRVDNGSAK